LYTVEQSAAVLERLKQELAVGARESAESAARSPALIKAKPGSAPAITADGQGRSNRAGELARKWTIPVISVAAIGIATFFVATKLSEPNGLGVPAAGPPQSSKPANAPPTSAEVPPPTVDSRPSSAAQSKPEVMTPAPAPAPARAAVDAPILELPKPATTGKSNIPAKPKSDAAPAVLVPATVAPVHNNARCSRIMEKATLGEALSTEEKKELASSCR
jgi:hypothetical protein